MTLSIAEALNDGTALRKIINPNYSISVVDTAANIEAMTIEQIASLSELSHIREVEASDTNIALTANQAIEFEYAGPDIALVAPDGSTVSVSDTATNLHFLSTDEIAAFKGAGITQVVSTTGAVQFTAAQTVALENAGISASAPGASVTLYDSSGGFAALTAANIAGLPSIGVSSVMTSSSVALTVAQALALRSCPALAGSASRGPAAPGRCRRRR